MVGQEPPPALRALTVRADPQALGEHSVAPVPEGEVHHRVPFGFEDAPRGETVPKHVAGALAVIVSAEPGVTRERERAAGWRLPLTVYRPWAQDGDLPDSRRRSSPVATASPGQSEKHSRTPVFKPLQRLDNDNPNICSCTNPRDL